MKKISVFKQVGIVLAVAVVVLALILVLTYALNGPARMLTSKELALEQTRIALNIFIKQTEVARTSTAGLYLTLGVPFPTETPFIVPTSGSLGRPPSMSTGTGAQAGSGAVAGPGQRTQEALPLTTSAAVQQTQALTATPAPGQPRLTATATMTPSTLATQPEGWGGEWTMYFGGDWEELTIGEANVTVSGKTLSATGVFGGDNMTMSGELTEDGQQVYGEFSLNGVTGSFFWQLTEPGQFGGNMQGNLRFCGSKGDLPQPELCGIYFEQ